MAEMIPESISAHPNVTPGEKRVFKVFQEGLQPDEDFLVWYEPRAIDRYPDFIVWGQFIGCRSQGLGCLTDSRNEF